MGEISHLCDDGDTQPCQQCMVYVDELEAQLDVVIKDRAKRGILLVCNDADNDDECLEDQLAVCLLISVKSMDLTQRNWRKE